MPVRFNGETGLFEKGRRLSSRAPAGRVQRPLPIELKNCVHKTAYLILQTAREQKGIAM
jgi:hypothetical protein